MRSEDLKRFFRAILFLAVSMLIMFVGMLPGDFSHGSLQISSFFYAWTAAFILRRPGSVGIVVILLAATQYAIYNDEGLALGSLAYLMFALLLHEAREYFAHQTFTVEVLSMTLLYFLTQLFKNLILQLFFTYHFPLLTLLKFSLVFAISYAIFSGLISGVIGRRRFENSKAS